MADSTLNRFVSAGTAAARAAYTPTPPTPSSGPTPGYFWHETDTGDTYSWKAGTGWIKVNTAGASYTDEQAQDAVGAMVDTTLVYTDATPLLTRAALTGDVTASAGSNATTIANDAVTYAQMQNASAGNVVLARAAGTSGDYSEVALSASNLLGRGSSGNVAALTLDPGLELNGTVLRTARGSSFPGSPASGDRFLRADRNIEYFYDGTRWLGTNLIPLSLAVQDGINPITGTATWRSANPFFGVYDLYIEKCTLAYFPTSTTAGNYFVNQFRHSAGASSTNLGSTISTQSVTISQWGAQSVSPATVVASTAVVFEMTVTETGTATVYMAPIIYGRLVG